MKNTISTWFQGLQDRICLSLEQLDTKEKFKEDKWERTTNSIAGNVAGGGGKTRILQNGALLEKGGVAFSAVFGEINQNMQSKLQMPQGDFFATGVSIVLHPHNPHVPIIHMNVRYFEIYDPKTQQTINQWFGGGIDLTPHYVNLEDAQFFHQQLKNTCDSYDNESYVKYKKWADDYFYIKHRQETRGIGGIFFDRLTPSSPNSLLNPKAEIMQAPKSPKGTLIQENLENQEKKHTFEEIWAFVQNLGETFAPTYAHIAQKNRDLPFTEQEKRWQMLRRSRYVEYNLIYDAGTKFGLESDGRVESILMSMPPQAQWAYDFKPEKDSEEEKTLNLLKKDIDFLVSCKVVK